MNHLLDVNVLLAAIWESHPHHKRAFDWLEGKSVALCPLTELGFLRISTHKKAFNYSMEQSRELLAKFATERHALRIADDLPALDSKPFAIRAVKSCWIVGGGLSSPEPFP